MNRTTLDEARAAKPKALEAFRRLGLDPGVGITRVGAGYGLKINLTTAPAAEHKLPETIEGVPLSLEVVGKIWKQ